ncbi:hypothetical protein TGPRC2_316760 [Toxoplasma gondii TgCatPRC2]|uniref:Uncharacterized protein n=7 Tax=Toxoplasma gondii TaxID=5811 RepID=A0A125YFI9_TOXGV|nr:hypothetical protein TGME49_316760 [Toxoplasma gondii ME49]ESS35421.1 hypothetical protein TGVEG_316760 [Toxoplasma gondii VEG]KFG29546.1 hypothetical protein TGDOM2_316760 [Toxoplasma gondii GAB2-2007-GAL-DOM2]KFG56479.1 hypothetical protein TGFOU_316760 [Toxoplasma gondii FOU]KYF40331.1 hypothetical protein TGARI_316760 [Toxoplasma gondii ARI]KYK65563.1 hypothetical protein TGPRC2_316760 [Toxoplasma gondii TgCatPRC2]PUA86750.1 hypothetical protein TGBR9_316760 [Toxoplasma gondii TgCATBr9|eukprot:XP_018635280.1 hypothetical protein TGME49_316760 [Toxoplasma gondii ME49]
MLGSRLRHASTAGWDAFSFRRNMPLFPARIETPYSSLFSSRRIHSASRREGCSTQCLRRRHHTCSRERASISPGRKTLADFRGESRRSEGQSPCFSFASAAAPLETFSSPGDSDILSLPPYAPMQIASCNESSPLHMGAGSANWTAVARLEDFTLRGLSHPPWIHSAVSSRPFYGAGGGAVLAACMSSAVWPRHCLNPRCSLSSVFAASHSRSFSTLACGPSVGTLCSLASVEFHGPRGDRNFSSARPLPVACTDGMVPAGAGSAVLSPLRLPSDALSAVLRSSLLFSRCLDLGRSSEKILGASPSRLSRFVSRKASCLAAVSASGTSKESATVNCVCWGLDFGGTRHIVPTAWNAGQKSLRDLLCGGLLRSQVPPQGSWSVSSLSLSVVGAVSSLLSGCDRMECTRLLTPGGLQAAERRSSRGPAFSSRKCRQAAGGEAVPQKPGGAGEREEPIRIFSVEAVKEWLGKWWIQLWKGNRWKGPQRNKWKWYHRHGYWATRKKLIDFTKYRRYGYHERRGLGKPRMQFWEDPSHHKRLKKSIRFW